MASSVVLLFTNLLNFQVCFFANGHGSSCSDGPAGGVWHQLIPRLPRVLVIQGLQVLLEHVVVAQVALAEALEKVSLRVFANWIINSINSRFHLLLSCPHVFWCGWWKLCWCSRGGGVSSLCGVRGRCGSSLSGGTVVVTMAVVHSIRLLLVYTRVGTVRVLEVLDTLHSLGSLSEEGEENQLVVTVMLLVVELDTLRI